MSLAEGFHNVALFGTYWPTRVDKGPKRPKGPKEPNGPFWGLSVKRVHEKPNFVEGSVLCEVSQFV